MLDKRGALFRSWFIVLFLSLSACTQLVGDFSVNPGPTPDAGWTADAGVDGGPLPNLGPIVVTPLTGLITSEAGRTAQFTIVLKSKPTSSVVIGLDSSNRAEGVASPTSVTFTTNNWSAPQTVTVTGQDDSAADGNRPYNIITAKASSQDSNYANVDPPDVSVTNVDNETAGFTITPDKGLVTNESRGEAYFTIVLNTKPKGNVTVALSSSDTGEGKVAPPMMVFTPDNWMSPQMATVSGEDDSIPDGPQAYKIVTAPAVSPGDVTYDKVDPDDIDVVNEDNDTAGFTLTPKSGLVTNENGQMATFTLALNFAPSANVVIRLSSSNTNEGVVNPTTLTFTPANWKAPQMVTVSGLDDAVADGDQPFEIVTATAESGDPAYNRLDPPNMTVTNVDNDSPGVTVKPAEGLVTTEAGGTATFTIVLNSRPLDSVVIGLSSSLPTEGKVTPAQVTFTRTSWNAPQTVTVTGVDDLVADGNMPYLVRTAPAVSSDMGYSGFDGPDVKITSSDDDSAGFIVMPTMGLVTSEKGEFATFTIALTSKPTSEVRIPLISTNTGEGIVSPTILTFTPDNYRAPQTVTVTGVDDKMEDGNQAYRIATYNAESDDLGYKGLPVPDVEVTNTDDDSAGIFVRPLKTPLETSEKGDTAQFTVVLTSQPAPMTTVTIPLSSTNAQEGTVSPATLVFTGDNWNAPRTVTVTGVNDDIQDGNQEYRVTIAKATSTDPKYNDMDVPDPVVTNIDNDVAGITVKPPAMPTTTENGGTATFTVELNSRPASPVTVRLTSSLTSEGTVSPATLTFSTTDWNAPQVVTVTGFDDRIADGNQPYTIVTQPATSDDPNYNDVNAADVLLTNTDDDSPGFIITPRTPLTTNEDGVAATFTVRLQSQPVSDVTIAVRSNDLSEGRTDVTQLVFTAANYNAPHTVTVTGVGDDVADGNQSYLVILEPAVSSDMTYNGRNPVDVIVSNTDNDSAGITVSPAAGNTREDGTTTTFTVRLTSQPSGMNSVTIPLSSNNTNEGTIMQPSLVFTTQNWSAPQTVTVRGVDDSVADGNQQYRAVLGPAMSDDLNYRNLDGDDVLIVNVDNDKAGITVGAAAGSTTEGGGTSTFSVVLDSQPTADVTIPISSSDVTEGTVMLTMLAFTPVNWAAPQTVTVRGVDDFVADGNQTYRILLGAASGGDYAAIDPPDVEISNIDDDSPGFIVTPTSGLVTNENGGTATFTVRLTSEPVANVAIGVHSSDVTEGAPNVALLTFTPANYNSPQTVTVRGLNDDVADGNQTYRIILDAAMSADGTYNSRDPEDVSARNTDNDSAGITVSAISNNTTEAGGQATFTVALNSQPTANVTLNFDSADKTEGTVDRTSLTFTEANWNGVQTVTVTGVNDNLADGEQPYSIVFTATASADPAYAAITPNNVIVRNTDNDSAGISVSAISARTTEAGGQATFTVVLNSEPNADVTVNFGSNDASEGTSDRTSLTFTNQNWNSPQTVRVTGVDDAVADGEQQYAIVFSATTSGDPAYAIITPGNVAVANTDNDSAGISVSAISGKTTEGGVQATFTIVLNSQPTADVTVLFNSNDLGEGTVNRTSVAFTATNWNAPQTVTVTGVNDDIADGEQPYAIVFTATMSGDAAYAAILPNSVAVANTDNDSAGIKVTVVSSTTTEAGGQATFTVALNSQPFGDVTVNFNSNDPTEGTVSQTSLTFTPVNWASAQSVIVTGVDDDRADGHQPYAVVFTATTGGDTAYNAITPGNVNLSNTDNDTAGINVSAISGNTSETGTQATFTVRLNSQPTADVTVNFNSNDLGEGTVDKTSLTFTPVNWSGLQTVTVTGVDDPIADNEQSYAIVFSATVSADLAYQVITPGNVAVANTDNDSAGINVSAISRATTELGQTATFTVVLNSQPTAQVTVNFSVNDPSEGTLNGVSSLTFLPGNWDGVQTVTVTGVDDPIADGDQDYAVVFGVTASTDAAYQAITPGNVAVRNTDNDSAGFAVSTISGNTTEAAGTATFSVTLNSQPIGGATVSVNLSSTNTGEGTVSPATLVFEPSGPNAWNVAHTVTVTGVNDFVADGPQLYHVHFDPTTSGDAAYNNKTIADVAVTNTDNDTAGIHVSATSLTTTEAAGEGHTRTFTIVLNSQPVGSVTVSFAPFGDNAGEGTIDVPSVTFGSGDWSTPKVVTVTGVDDAIDDGNQNYVIRFGAITGDANYAALPPPGDITVTNVDDDAIGITVSTTSLTTTEAAGPSHTATFTVRLNSQPSAAQVIVSFNVNTAGVGEGSLSPTSLTFTPGNWSAPQTVTVTGVVDNEDDGDKAYEIQFAATTGGDYAGIVPSPIAVTNIDSDTAGITMTLDPAGVCSTTPLATATFLVRLNSEPSAGAVVIQLATSDPTMGTVMPSVLSFNLMAGDWNTPQAVTVTGGGVGGAFTVSASGDAANMDANYRASTSAAPQMCTNTP
jgi:hypothetical protein